MRKALRSLICCLGITILCLGVGVCDPSGQEPEPMEFAVLASDGGIVPCTNAEGWTIELSQLRVAAENLELTIEGETHASWQNRLRSILISPALAHPGHYAGGEVTGELPGPFIVDLLAKDPVELGRATLLPGDYNGMNLWFRTATADDRLAAGDLLLGHTAVLSGTARRGDLEIAFLAILDIAAGTRMVGGPFDLRVSENTQATLGLTVFTVDPSEGDTLFDGLDFGALDEDGDGEVRIEPGDTAHNVLMKTFVRHDHWGMELLP